MIRPVGKLAAYLTPDPGDGKKHPAIVWITGGDCNSIGELWEEAPRDNDQTAAAYRKAGIIMMFPSLRGGNDNPGRREGFLGEVDDVLAAADYLARQDYVDPTRIYLGGHSTGGTLVMLVAESTDRFRAVFSFGPVDDVSGYGPRVPPVRRVRRRRRSSCVRPAAGSTRSAARCSSSRGPIGRATSARCGRWPGASTNPLIRFLPVTGVNHFSILAPANELIAAKILADDGPTTKVSFESKRATILGEAGRQRAGGRPPARREALPRFDGRR